MGVEVRAATDADEAVVLRLLGKLLGDRMPTAREAGAVFRGLLMGHRGRVLVATEGDDVLGVITMSYNPAIRYGGAYAQIEELIVDEATRGKKAGAALVNAAIAEARAHGCKEMGLYPLRGNEPFYEKLGFSEVGVEMRMPLRREG